MHQRYNLYGTDFAFLSGLICISYIVGKGADINVNYGYGRGGRVLSEGEGGLISYVALLNSLDDTPRPSDNTGSRRNFAPTREHAEKKTCTVTGHSDLSKFFFTCLYKYTYIFLKPERTEKDDFKRKKKMVLQEKYFPLPLSGRVR